MGIVGGNSSSFNFDFLLLGLFPFASDQTTGRESASGDGVGLELGVVLGDVVGRVGVVFSFLFKERDFPSIPDSNDGNGTGGDVVVVVVWSCSGFEINLSAA